MRFLLIKKKKKLCLYHVVSIVGRYARDPRCGEFESILAVTFPEKATYSPFGDSHSRVFNPLVLNFVTTLVKFLFPYFFLSVRRGLKASF